ncbi:MAG: CHASE domain-containing protein, partial [Acidimicrobiales bacterium]
MNLAIQHEQDLAVSAGAFIAENPDVSQTDFVEWTAAVRAFDRYPEIQGIGEVVLVPASELSAFVIRAMADPAGTLPSDGTFQIIPAGARPYYCFEAVAQSRAGPSTTPAGLDLCASALGPALLKARDSGQGAYVPYAAGGRPALVVGTP